MVGSSGYARRSQPTICWGDHLCASLVATASRKAGYVAKRHCLGRRPRAHARWSAAAARYRRGPPWRRTSRLTVEGARPRSRLICRTDKPRATPREIHDLMRTRPFATVVAYGPDGLFANHLPLVLHCRTEQARYPARARDATQSTLAELRSRGRGPRYLSGPTQLHHANLVSLDDRTRQGGADLELRGRARLRPDEDHRGPGVAAGPSRGAYPSTGT